MPKLARVLDENLLRVQFDKKVRHGIFHPVARRLPVDIAQERLQDAICQTFEMYRRYALEKGKVLPDAILVHYCRLRAVDPGRHFMGAELSALSRLDWADVDFTAGRIRIPGTKNATRDRTIDLDPQLAAALRRVPPARRVGPVLRPWVNACTDLRAPATALASTGSRHTHFGTPSARGLLRPGSTPSWSAS